MAADPRGDELVGRTLGDFVLGEILGGGGFGAIYAARQPALERDAVIKILSSERRGQLRSTKRFFREAKLASRLDHPFAAHIYNFGAEEDGLLWIAMERVRGTTLRELLAERPTDADAVCSVLRSIGRGRQHGARPGHYPPRSQARKRHGDFARRSPLAQASRPRYRSHR